MVGLLDLYGSGLRYPEDISVNEKYTWAKQKLEPHVGDRRFRQHFAVHETEAWLLSAPDIFPRKIRERLRDKASHPETVDFQTPPAKLLQGLYRQKLGREYKKVTDGPKLFRKLDPELAYQRCPHLKFLLDEMLELANTAGR